MVVGGAGVHVHVAVGDAGVCVAVGSAGVAVNGGVIVDVGMAVGAGVAAGVGVAVSVRVTEAPMMAAKIAPTAAMMAAKVAPARPLNTGCRHTLPLFDWSGGTGGDADGGVVPGGVGSDVVGASTSSVDSAWRREFGSDFAYVGPRGVSRHW